MAKRTLAERLSDRLKRSWPVVLAGTILTSITLLAAGFAGFQALKNIFQPPPPKLVFHYRTLEGHSLSLFLQGAIPADLKEQIGTQYIIVDNDVWRFGSNLLRRHGYRADGQGDTGFQFSGITASNTMQLAETEEALTSELKKYRLLDGTTWDDRTFESSRTSPFDEDGFMETMDVSLDLLDEDSENALRNNGVIKASSFRFQRSLSCQEFDQLAEEYAWPYRDFYREIMANDCPDKFATAYTWFTNGCASGWYVKAHPPRLKLRVVAIQNTDSKVASLSSLLVRADTRTGVRSAPSLGTTLQSLPLNDIPLRPGETAYVALQFLMTHDSTEEGDEAPPDDVSVVGPEDIARIASVTIERDDTEYEIDEVDPGADGYLESYDGKNDEVAPPELDPEPLDSSSLISQDPQASEQNSISIEGTKLASWLASSIANSSSENDGWEDFTIGPSQKLEMVTGPRYKLAARMQPEKTSVISEYMQGGSCPRLFATYIGSAKAVYKGKFLVDANFDGVNEVDHIKLDGWPSSLTIEEWESETTRLKSVDVVCYKNDGERIETPVAKYSVPYELNMGEKLTLPVPQNSSGVSCDMVLAKFNGHYAVNSASSVSTIKIKGSVASSVIKPSARYKGEYCTGANKAASKLVLLRR